jgi:hypothetical protein
MIPKGKYYALYPCGSRVYGTQQPYSDYDFFAIKEGVEAGDMERGLLNLKMMSPGHFQNLLDEHRPSALECLFLPKELVVTQPSVPWKFELSLPKLRHSFARLASRDFVRAKKKFVSPYEWAKQERRRGKKSLFHSLRLMMFGAQIAEHGKIVDYSEANKIYEEIMENTSEDWEDYSARWKPEYNRLCTEFRKLAPKE